LKADLKDEKSCQAMVEQAAEKLGRLDILVNNAGINIRKAPQDYTLEEWHEVMDTSSPARSLRPGRATTSR
jgi:2-deoxy-D-gluconate 3-dehydrogenase